MTSTRPLAALFVWVSLALAIGCSNTGDVTPTEPSGLPHPIVPAVVEPTRPPSPDGIASTPGAEGPPGVGPVFVVPEIFPAKKTGDAPLPAPKLTSPTPAPVTSWRADGNHPAVSGVSADPDIAVSKTRVLVTTRAGIAWYTKAGRLISGPTAASSFFPVAALGLATASYFINDCRSLYHDDTQRFVIACLYHDTTSPLTLDTKGKVLMAVSKSSVPEDGFHTYAWGINVTAIPAGQVLDLDYGSLGSDSSTIHFTFDVVDAAASAFRYHHVLTRNISDMAAGLTASSVRKWSFSGWLNPDGTGVRGVVYPATHHGTTSTGYLVHKWDATRVNVWAVSNATASNRSFTRTTVTMQTFNDPPGPMLQSPNGTLTQKLWTTPVGSSPISAEWRAGKLVFTNNDRIDCGASNGGLQPGMRFSRIDTSTIAGSGTATLEVDRIFGCGTVGDTTYFQHGWPGVGLNAAGDAVIVFNRSNATSWASVRASVYRAADPDISPSTAVKGGEAEYVERSGASCATSATCNGLTCVSGQCLQACTTDADCPANSGKTCVSAYCRFAIVGWADLSGVSIDPYDNTAGWTAASYARSGVNPPNWGVWVAKILGSAVSDLVPVGASGPASVTRGTASNFTFTIENQGDGAMAASTYKVYLSTNGTISAADTVLATVSLGALASNGTTASTVPITIPTSVSPGSYFIGVCLDTGGVQAEYSELNNCQVATDATTAPALAVNVL